MNDENADDDYTEAIEANSDLLERLRSGDVHALASLMEAVLGLKVTATRQWRE